MMRIIPLSPAKGQKKSWQKELANARISLDELCHYLQLSPTQMGYSEFASRSFPLRVTQAYLAGIRKGDPSDPLLRQILPSALELQSSEGFSHNPVGDLEASVVPGLIHKYPNRVLMITTPACGIHCRYCFRRHYPYRENSADNRHLEQALDYIARHEQIIEVILSGGDPLSLSDESLSELIERLEKIPHLRLLRLHTRMPLVLPSRLTDLLSGRLQQSRLKTTMVLHCNHPNELSADFDQSLKNFAFSGLTLLNQSVLLQGVNDNAFLLHDLSHALFDRGILPYYLHMLDPVSGAAHFNVVQEEATALHRQLRAMLPGYLVPRLIRDSADTGFKENAY